MFQKRILLAILFCTSFLIFNVGSVTSIGPEIVLSETRPVRMVKCSSYEPRFNKYFNDFKIIIDSSDQIYIGGQISHDTYDSELLVTDLMGTLMWQNLSRDSQIYDIALDSLGNIYCTGIKYVDIFNTDIFLWKFDNSGAFKWERLINGFENEWGRGIAIDSLNNVYVAGYNSSEGMIAAKYNPLGEREWLINWGKELDAACLDCTIDGSDNLYLVGTVSDLMGSDMCILKLDSLGGEMWNLTFPLVKGSYSDDRLWNVVSDANNYIYVLGDIFERTIYVAQFDSNGCNLWNTTWMLDNKVLGVSDLAVDTEENVYVVGNYKPYETSDWRYDNQRFSYLVKFQHGNEKWHYYWKFSEYTRVSSIALNDGEIYVCGSSDGELFLVNFSESVPIIALYALFSWLGGALTIFIIISSFSKKKKIRES
ncbi:MAG: hypothetical protein EU533_05945 [Promethearchaeota archaeon]|nr:MAG: hypothetical protein EU533_05945 [Candidatus Lokiarchaeota archaeon]